MNSQVQGSKINRNNSIIGSLQKQPSALLRKNINYSNIDESTPYYFDHVFDPEITTSEIYEKVLQDIALAAMVGYHGAILAYGQTSTGKTFTMQVKRIIQIF